MRESTWDAVRLLSSPTVDMEPGKPAARAAKGEERKLRSTAGDAPVDGDELRRGEGQGWALPWA